MSILVTGAGGFTGTHLVRHLASASPKSHIRAMVRSLDNRSLDNTGAENAGAGTTRAGIGNQAVLAQLGAEVVAADLTDRESLRRALTGVKQVYHIAALFRQAGVPDQAFYDVNVQGTRNLFEECIAAGVERIVHCSTVGVLGDIASPPGNESTAYAPGDIYQKTKMEGELVALEYFRSGKIGGVVIRPAMIYGPGDTRTLKLFKAVARKRFFYVGPGNKKVHFVDVRDLAHAFALAMEHTERNAEVYIISGRESKPLKAVAASIADYFGVPAPWLHVPILPVKAAALLCELICIPLRVEPPIFRRRVDFFTKHREFDWQKAKRELGYHPRNSFHEEIREICRWYVHQGWISQGTAQGQTPATIVREISGRITHWDAVAEKSYGWHATEAIGMVTHNLFRTEFPAALDVINEQILTTKSWEGNLVHTTRTGEKICVQSRWELCESDGEPVIIERNRRIEDSTGGRRLQELGQRVGAILPAISEVIESGLLGLAAAA